MRGSSRLLAVAILLVVVLAAVLGYYLWRQWEATRPLPPPKPPVELPDSFEVEDVPVQSPQLALHLVGMRGTVHPDYTDWACLLECREREGCHATVEVRVEYRSEGESSRLVIGGRIDGKVGEVMRIGRAQRPPVAVDGIDSVEVTVLRVHTDDEEEEELELDT
jgi:hypothetical protein